jgi:hypothetical protein
MRLEESLPETMQVSRIFTIEQEMEECPEAQRLQTHPGVGALTALAFVLMTGPKRYQI